MNQAQMNQAQMNQAQMNQARAATARGAGGSLNPLTAAPADATSGSSSTSDSSSSTISANDFLTLLVTEMQNQDPTADTDPNEYISQLVQVNSLEQLIDINQNLSTALGTSSGTSGSTSDGTSGGTSGGGVIPSQGSLPATGSAFSKAAPAATLLPPAAIEGKAGQLAHSSDATRAGAGSQNRSGQAAISRSGFPTTASAARNLSGGASTPPGSSGTAAAIRQFANSVNAQRAPGNLSIPSVDQAAQQVARSLNGRHRAGTPPRGKPAGQ
jgi:flagellar basal-body rod modification protein FlgD